jgi:hypothetical protein
MRTKAFFHPAMLAMGLFAFQNGQAQVSIESNSPVFPGTDYVGWDNTTNVPLMIRHDANQPIQWFTDARRRMQLYHTLQLGIINGFDTLDLSGYLALSGSPAFFNASRPFSRLHLADTSGVTLINAQQFGFRPWQRNGITFTGNADHGYFGQEHNGRDTTDMVLSWSNDFGTGQFSPDHLSIRFLSNHTGAASGASSMQGLEAMRFFPVDRDRVHVGIGDWFAGNILDPNITEPTEMLDVLTGRVRIRQLPTEAEMDTTWKVVVVNDDGVLGWRDPGSVPVGDCDWEVGVTPNEPHITTAHTSGSCDWDNRHGVGIGVDIPEHKLTVFHDDISLLGNAIAIHGKTRIALDAQGNVVGVDGDAAPPSNVVADQLSIGVMGQSSTSRVAAGVVGIGALLPGDDGQSDLVVGVAGFAQGTDNADMGCGIYGSASGSADDWAGYFVGNVNCIGTGYYVGGTFVASDAAFKTNVLDLEDPLSVLMALQPRSYDHLVDQYDFLDLPEGRQVGLIAQELELVVPNLVRETRIAP